jgi:hypothetical protein
MKRTPIKNTTRINPVSDKTRERNAKWKAIVLGRAMMLKRKYGFIPCEYSGETIECLTSTYNDPDDGWGHHIDGNRNNVCESNCLIVKYKFHRIIHNNNLKAEQEGFKK